MGVGERRPGAGPDILEDVDVLEALVLVEIDDPFAVGGEDLGDGGDGQVLQGEIVVGRLNDDFVRADAGEAVVEARPGVASSWPSIRMAG